MPRPASAAAICPAGAGPATGPGRSWPNRAPTPPPSRSRPPPTSASAGSGSGPGAGRTPSWNAAAPGEHHPGPPPIVEHTLIQIAVQHLPGGREPGPRWLWYSDPDAGACDIRRLWRLHLRRFDPEHTFRFSTQTPGLTRPRLRRPEQADRRVWLVPAAYAQ